MGNDYNTIDVNVCVNTKTGRDEGMIKALLFDLGGTLHTVKRTEESKILFCRHLHELLASHGIKTGLSPEELGDLLAVNSELYKHYSEETKRELPQPEIWSRWYLKELNIEPQRFAPFAEELSFLYDRERVINTPRPFLKETIETLHGMGIRMGIISNIISTTLVPLVLTEYGIAEYMECSIMSSVTGIRKPDPRIFEIAMEQMKITAAEMGYVGDTISRDVLGSRNAGLGLCVRIDNPSIAHRDAAFQGPDAPKADYVIKELNELPGIIQAVNGKAREE